jgi:hypothetical protein
MGALDDLIAQDEDNLRRSRGGASELDQLLAQDEARNLPSQDPEVPESPSFVGYDPASKPPPQDDGGIRGFARQLLNGPAQQQADDYQTRMNAQGVHPENALGPSDLYMGMMSGPFAAAKGAGLGARALASVGNRVLEGGAQGAVTGVRDAVDHDGSLSDVANEIMRGAGSSVALGAAGDVAGAVGQGAGRMADRWRNVVAGGTAADAKAAAKVYGLDAIDDPGRLLEKYSPSPALGLDSLGHARVVEDKLAASGGRLGDMVTEAEQMGRGKAAPQVDASVSQRMAQEADAMQRSARSQEDVQAANAFRESAGLIAKADPAQSLRDVITNKSNLQAKGHVGKAGTVPEKASAQANAAAGGFMRDELHGIMQTTPRYDEYQAENQQYSELATLLKSLTDKAGGEQSGGAPAIIASALAGGGIGAIGGVATGQDPLDTALLAAGGSALTGTNAGIRQTLGTRGADMDANMMRALQGLGGAADRALPAMRGAAAGAVSRRSQQQPEPGADVAVGHKLVREALRTNPTKLGPYAAMLDPNDPALDAKITNLGKEPMFRKLMRDLENEGASQMSQPQSGITYSFGEE